MQRQSNAVQEARLAAGMSREGLADRAGLSLSTVERIETGKTFPRRSTLRVIALALGVDEDQLRSDLPQAA
jgi:transcriptional regulator with XRE-family HTH domain